MIDRLLPSVLPFTVLKIIWIVGFVLSVLALFYEYFINIYINTEQSFDRPNRRRVRLCVVIGGYK